MIGSEKMSNRMLTPDEQEELRRKDAAEGVLDSEQDTAAPLKADVMGSMVNSNPNDAGGYLGRIDKLLTAHGALDASSRMGATSGVETMQPGTRADNVALGAMSQPRIPLNRMVSAEPPSIDARPAWSEATPASIFPNVNAPALMQPAKPKQGWLGKIGDVAKRMGNIALDVAAPGEALLIPGTDLNKQFMGNIAERNAARRRQLDIEATRAGAEKSTAETRAKLEPSEETKNLAEAAAAGKGKTPDEVTFNDLLTGNNGQPRINPKTKQPYTPIEAFQEVSAVKTAKPETQEQNKLAFQGVIGKLDAAGLPSGPKDVDKSLDTALQRGVITPQEHATARAYQAANPTPGTNLTVHVAGTQATENLKKANQHYLYTDEDGATHLVTGDKVPPGIDAVPVKDPQMFMSEAENANIVQKSFSKLAKDDLSIFDNPAARAVLATAVSEEGARSMGLLVAGTGGSITLPAGSGKIIDQFLENKAPGMDDKTRRALKDYIADYWAIKDKMLMVQMQMQNGKMGRGNKAYFDAMVSQIPGPGTADSTMARRQFADFNETLTELKKRYPDKFGGYRKEPDLKTDEFGGGNTPPPGARIRDYTQLRP